MLSTCRIQRNKTKILGVICIERIKTRKFKHEIHAADNGHGRRNNASYYIILYEILL